MLGHEYGATGSHSIDRNKFHGNAQQFELYLGGEVPEPEPEPPHEIFLPYVVSVDAPAGLYTHTEPNALASTRAGALFDGTEVTVTAEDGIWKLCRGEYWSSGDYLKRV